MHKLLWLLAAISLISVGLVGCGPEKDPWEADLKATPIGPRPGTSVGGAAPPPAPEKTAPEEKGAERRDEKIGNSAKTKASAG